MSCMGASILTNLSSAVCYSNSMGRFFREKQIGMDIREKARRIIGLSCMNYAYLMYLDTGAIDKLLKVLQPDDIMVDVSPYLQKPVYAVCCHTVWADAGAAVKTADVLFVLLGMLMEGACYEEFLCVEGL